MTAAGAPSPGCLTIPSGQLSAPFRLDAQLATNLTGGGDFRLRARRSHRDTNGWTPLDSVAVPFKAWRRPSLQAVALGALPSQPSSTISAVNASAPWQGAGYVALTAVAPPGGITVQLGCKATDAAGTQICDRYVSMPESLKIREGVREYGFPIATEPSPVEGRVGIEATLDGQSVTTVLNVDLPAEVTHVGLSATGQANFRWLTVHVSEQVRAEPVRIAVKISGDGARYFQIPDVVEVPVGETMATVSVPTTPFTQPVLVTLTAARMGSKVVVSDTVTIQP